MILSGKTFKYGDNVDTDVIIPARYLNSFKAEDLAGHCMEDIDADFVSEVKPGDIIAAGKNFGCGSSREHAPIAIKASGVSCVIAETFARIFFRNAVNIGLPIVECPEAVRNAGKGDLIEIDFDAGEIRNASLGETYAINPLPAFMREIMSAGGLVERTRRLLNNDRYSEAEPCEARISGSRF
jgi:3-isopropylmalate/(R)-2-methylmalate dehydratase small subunit